MTDTPNLSLPYLLAAQSQKHVTHNEALRTLDSVVQLSVRDRNLTSPPGSPAEGDRYIVASGATGTWAGQAGKVAAFQDAAWLFYQPKDGWIAWVADENAAVVWASGGWIALSSGGGGGGSPSLNPATGGLVGINATADVTNRLSLSSPASLFNHSGTGGHQVKINKASATDTASLLYQSGFSGRAELGTTGDDNFHLKVSANGSTWNEAIVIDRTSGAVTLPNTNAITAQVFTSSGTWTKQPGLVKIRVWGIGAGGSTADVTGAASQIEVSSGGGSGTFGYKEIFAASLGATETVTVGTPVAASAGGSSSFGAHMTLPGGGAGSVLAAGTTIASVVGGLAGPATGALWSIRGGYGDRGIRWSGTIGVSGRGADGQFGSGGLATHNGGALGGSGYGSGAGGACSVLALLRAGALGAPGIMLVEEIY